MRFIQPNVFLYFFLLILGMGGFFPAVIWPDTTGLYMFISFAAAGGFGVALYIYYTKRHQEQLVCPVGSDCNAVITSRYSKFLGVSLEYWGMLYYSLILIAYLVLLFAPQLLSKLFLSGLTLCTTGAFLFSLYLLFVQAFLLRQWCIWCLLSAMLSITIFITSLASIDVATIFLKDMTTALGVIHALGFILGMGGATTALVLFSNFLRDLDIDEKEFQTLKGISELIWLGLAMILVSQFAYFAASAEMRAQSGVFLVQTIALFVVAINSAIIMIIFAPLLAMIPFNEGAENHHHSPLESLRKPLFLTGAIAVSSWYFAFSMNYMPEYGFAALLSIYIAVLMLAIALALFWEHRISKRRTA